MMSRVGTWSDTAHFALAWDTVEITCPRSSHGGYRVFFDWGRVPEILIPRRSVECWMLSMLDTGHSRSFQGTHC